MKIYLVWYTDAKGHRYLDDIYLHQIAAENYVDNTIEREAEALDIVNSCTWAYGKEIITPDGSKNSWIISVREINEEEF